MLLGPKTAELLQSDCELPGGISNWSITCTVAPLYFRKAVCTSVARPFPDVIATWRRRRAEKRGRRAARDGCTLPPPEAVLNPPQMVQKQMAAHFLPLRQY
ncbi:hypothetical protein Bbelb_098860 [Branchiostoma belcheri]|nr:hypothetical protein Bbelb_098860 [Branchiostoma belcheri]